MRKLYLLLLAVFMFSSVGINAQVRIGGTGEDPNASAILDLNPSSTADAELALGLPRTALKSTVDLLKSTAAAELKGMTVYNTATTTTGSNDVAPGVYYHDGNGWVRVSGQGAPVITVQPKAFTFSRAYDQYGDPSSTVKSFTTTLTVTAVGATTYQWYKKAKNVNAADEKIANATTNTYSPSFTIASATDWGLNKYYCVVSNQYGSVKTDLAEIALGCGAKTETGGWLKFYCHNLGATQSRNPFGTDMSFQPSITTNPYPYPYANKAGIQADAVVYGDLYQWGRPADGYEKRGSDQFDGPASLAGANLPAAATGLGKFITGPTQATNYDWRTPQYDYMWRAHKEANDPCPPKIAGQGWHVPSQSQWGSIYQSGTSFGLSEDASSNTWTWEGGGYSIKPDGETITLFLPAAGHRSYSNSALYYRGTGGYYWSSTTSSSGAFYLHFNSTRVYPGHSTHRSHGFSVRCVSE